MDLDFGDELSEDWISQPPSSAPPSTPGHGSLATRPADSTRHRPQAAAAAADRNAVGTPNSSLQRRKDPLKERSASQLNAGTPNNAADKAWGQDDGPRDNTQDSLGSVANGTVQIVKDALKEEGERGATPEWRRRLVNGQRGLDDQRDLFASRSIERIFDKPQNGEDLPSPKPSSPRPKKSMLPQAINSPSRPPTAEPSSRPAEMERANYQITAAGSPKAQFLPGRRPGTAPITSHLRFSRVDSGAQPPLERQRKRSQSVPRLACKASEDSSEAPERPSSRSSDSALHNSHDQADRPDIQPYRTVSGSSAADPRLSASTKFVTTTRGNVDADDSFFTRPLSPISFEQASLPPVDGTTTPVEDPGALSPAKTPASPLKLFAEDDSFTSRRLHRRVSEFEDEKVGPDMNATSWDKDTTTKEDMAENPTPISRSRANRRVSHFGIGDLDKHTFEPHSSAQDMPPLELKSDKQRPSERIRALSNHGRRVISQLSEKRQHQEQEADEPRVSDPTIHANKKRILAAPRRASSALERHPSRSSTGDFAPSTSGDSFDSLDLRGISVAGRKRKDARYYDEPGASPEKIALRAILEAKGQSNRRVSRLVAAIATQRVDHAHGADATRKKSITTADFFTEANLIMQRIRAKNHPRSSFMSEQSPLSELSDQSGSFFHEEFTIEQLSRPASREGSELRKQPTPRALDARIVSHLRKFQDEDDLDLEWSSSSRQSSEPLVEASFVTESDPPNIRIRERIPQHDERTRKSSNAESVGALDQASVGRPTSQGSSVESLPTGSSRGSATRATISPDKVSHLITLTMGDMTFDQKKLCWVRQKAMRPALNFLDAGNTEISEEDPLGDIPDLTVNESQEIRTTKKLAGLLRAHSKENESAEYNTNGPGLTGGLNRPFDPSSTISESHRFASSGPIIETRATSWGDLPTKPTQARPTSLSGIAESPKLRLSPGLESSEDLVPEGYSTEEPALHRATLTEHSDDNQHQPGVRTISSNAQTADDAFVPGPAVSSSHHIPSRTAFELAAEGDQSAIPHEAFSPVELSGLLPVSLSRSQNESMQLAISTPQTRAVSATPWQSVGRAFHYSAMHLSPLPDFTVHQPDESLNLDMDYAIRRRGLSSLPELEKNFSLAIEDLVGKITDIEPHEPYWEYMRQLSLKGQKLWTLHMLADFCSRVEELDVSKNELGQLNGAPRSLQALSVSNNQLSTLTAWAHLPNLQYLDVSYNKIGSLKSFSCLMHLRDLNLEGNDIEDLEGISDLGSVISLNLKGNKLKKLDLRGMSLRRLKSLDVRGNQIEQVLGLEGLESLRDLNLRENNLDNFRCASAGLPKSVRRLDLSANRLKALDLTDAPPLDSLLIDRNDVRYVKGIRNMRSIRKVSWRYQTTQSRAGQEALEFDCCKQAHLLDLSKNKIPRFAPKTPFLNLRRLELASCGIQSLGEDFGVQMPNLRMLNLNDNGISDIRPLLEISTLEELYVARNRLTKLRLTTKVFREFSQTLRYLDCRDNPFTLGFYPPATGSAGETSQTEESRDMSLALAGAKGREERKQAFVAIDEAEDADYVTRLDEETLLRRRVYEALLMYRCNALVFWDGLNMGYRRELDREGTWERLLELGVLTKLPPA